MTTTATSYDDYPAYCHRYTTDAGDEHVELCSFHAQLAANQTLPGLEKWTYELNDLYKEWIDLSMEKDRAAVASSQAFFMLWLEQQRIALELQEAENVDDYIEALLRNQCVDSVQPGVRGPDGIILNERRTNHEYCQL